MKPLSFSRRFTRPVHKDVGRSRVPKIVKLKSKINYEEN